MQDDTKIPEVPELGSVFGEQDKIDWDNNKSEGRILYDKVVPDPMRRDKAMCFDIETYKWEDKPLFIEKLVEEKTANYVKPDIIEKHRQTALEKLALDPFTGQIILSGFYDGKDTTFITGEEKSIVEETIDFIEKSLTQGYRLVTKGGKRFDLPYLLTRAAILNISRRFAYQYSDLFNKYKNFYHTDLETIFEKHSLGSMAYIFGLADVPGNRGSEIAGLYEADNMEGIIEKNKEDLVQSYNIYERIKWINL